MPCPACGNPRAIILFTSVECPNAQCRNFCPDHPEFSKACDTLTAYLNAYYEMLFKAFPAPLTVTP